MSGDIIQFLEQQKLSVLEDKRRLGLLERHEYDEEKTCDIETIQNNNSKQSFDDNKENVQLNSSCVLSTKNNKTLPFIEPLNLNRDNISVTLEEKKQAFIDNLVNSESPFTDRSNDSTKCAMLRYGEYSPNNPQLRVSAAPYLGLGEYEQRRNYFLQKQRAEYLKHLAKVQYDLQCQSSAEKELSPHFVGNDKHFLQNNSPLEYYRIDQRLTSAQNALLKQEMDKPKSILSNRRTGSPRERRMTDLYSNPTNSFMDSFSYQPSRSEEVERERLKREAYQQELRLQIEEKRHMQQMREEQERREQELENRRLEQQLLRMQEERLSDEQRRNQRDDLVRRHSEDWLRRKQELHSSSFRKHTDSESSLTSCLRTDVASKPLSHYSPPVSRRNPYSFNVPATSVFSEPSSRYNPSRYDTFNRRDTLRRMDSLNSYDRPTRHNTFSRFDSLSRIDALTNRVETMSLKDSLSEGQRRHSATQQDLSLLRRSPRLHRPSSSGRFDDPLPIPLIKAHSPVAREFKNSVPFNSSRHSDAVRRLEDKWQVPAVQKNIMNHTDSVREGQSRSILTQLGAIRMQLQQEQLRMEESLRKQGISQSKAVNFH